ncbi:MAG: hypothetical protein HYS70_01045 [Nitrospinae bacterium]|nr:hypothetical protein [Nitrospinota bacterium]
MIEDPGNRISLRELAEQFDALQPETVIEIKPPENEAIATQYWDEDVEIFFQNSFYKIINQLGSGGIGKTFKVVHVDKKNGIEYGTYVAKVISHPEDGDAALQAYRKVRAHTAHPHLSVIHEIAPEWDKNSFVALMKWVPGIPLSDLTGVLPLHAEDQGEVSWESMVLRWVDALCDALGSLHRVGLVHGDVTPKNIIVSGGEVILTDYDAVIEAGGKPRIDNACYSSPTVQQFEKIEPSDDIFALGASFFHVLFDREPFRFDGEFRKTSGVNFEGISLEEMPFVAQFLSRATSLDQSQRFGNGMEVRLFIRQLTLSETEETSPLPFIPEQEIRLAKNEVPRLLDILRTYPGSLKGNDETRGLDSKFAEQTYVETRLDQILVDQIKNHEVSLAILFGNAGDGKTAFLQHLAMQLGLKKHHSSERLWNHTLSNGIRIKANLDGSASYQGKTATELLDEFFAPYQNCTPPGNLVHLLAINSGPLQAWILDYEQRQGETRLTEQLQAVLDGDLSQLDHKFRFLDLNNRSLVGGLIEGSEGISTDFLDHLLERLLSDDKGEDLWWPCPACRAKSRCSAWESVSLLQDPEKGSTLRQRFYEALQAAHQRGEIHITARELRATLSYIFFGLPYCTDLHENPGPVSGHYYDRAFDPDSPGRQGELLQEMLFLDPALEAHPQIDRYLLGHGNAQGTISSSPYPGLPLKSARRRAYFEWRNRDIVLDKTSLGTVYAILFVGQI